MSSIAMFDDDPRRSITLGEFLRALAEIIAEPSDDIFLQKLEHLRRRRIAGGLPEDRRSSDASRVNADRNSKRDRNVQDSDKINRRQVPQSFPMTHRSYTPKQIAALEGVKADSVREWIRDGKLKSVPDPHRRAGPRGRHIILVEDYERFKRGGH
jgi:hypothetical protein